jgi:hypothetical protein
MPQRIYTWLQTTGLNKGTQAASVILQQPTHSRLFRPRLGRHLVDASLNLQQLVLSVCEAQTAHYVLMPG